ncbi:hypothetical protein ACIGXF_38855 [Streptomyces sp. NPDC053086]
MAGSSSNASGGASPEGHPDGDRRVLLQTTTHSLQQAALAGAGRAGQQA